MDSSKIRVLLVDPEETFASLVERAFTRATGRSVLSRAHTLAEARARLAAVPQDIVISDLRLSDGAATDLLTSNGDRSDFPVVVLVRRGEEAQGAAAVEAGAVDFYVKNGADVGDLPRLAMRSKREWTHIVERGRAEKTIVQLRAQVHQFQRLVASGLMARGVAHDVEDLLDPILGYAELALKKIPPRGQARGEVEHVVKVTKLAKDLVRDALVRSRDTNGARKQVDVSAVVLDVLDLLRPVAPAGVEIRSGATSAGATVAIDSTQLHRILMNLCINGFDAMRPSGGILQIDVDLTGAAGPDGFGDSKVRVTVTDTGHGMDPKLLGRIFEPFFTTKSAGEGLGLGLSLANELVRAHNGEITAESEPGKGTVIKVQFPRYETNDVDEDDSIEPGPRRASIVV